MVHECPSCGVFFTDDSLTLRQRVRFRLKCKRCRRHEHLTTIYGISIHDYEAMLHAQGGVCAICGAAPKKKPLVVDHDHKTGKVRGLLCNGCNSGIGHFRDDITALDAAATYLRSHQSPE